MRSITLAAWILLATQPVAAEIPDRPELLRFERLSYELPDSRGLRFELDNHTRVYILSDRLLPIVRLELLFRGGAYLDPPAKAGLAALSGAAWRSGGAGDRTAQQFDEELERLAAKLTVDMGEIAVQVTLDVLSDNFEPAMALLMDLLTDPRFQEDRFELARTELKNQMRARNDSLAAIEFRQWRRLVYGESFWVNRLPTEVSVGAITMADCRRFVASLIGAGNLAVGVSGDFDPTTVTTLLQRTIGKLPRIARPIRAVGQPRRGSHPGVYLVDTPGASQGLVRIGHLGLRLGHPDEPALTVLDRILGGGDFTSRMVKRIRSDEGLAYAAWSEMTFPSSIPGHFSAVFQSESSTVARATEITMDLVLQLRTDPVTPEELTTSISYLADAYPTRFETPAAIVGTFAADELLDRPVGYWTGYRDRVRSVTAEDVKAVAVKHLDPDRMMILIVGDIDKILEGHPDFKARISDFGTMKRLPLRDPMTLEPMEEASP